MFFSESRTGNLVHIKKDTERADIWYFLDMNKVSLNQLLKIKYQSRFPESLQKVKDNAWNQNRNKNSALHVIEITVYQWQVKKKIINHK